MNLNAAALRYLASKGFTTEDVAALVASNETTRDPTAAERQARCRARKRHGVTVTRDPLDEVIILNPGDNPKPIGLAPPQKSKRVRGTRLPSDWKLDAEWAEWAKVRRRWSDAEIAEEAEIFANYWQAKSGAGACHTDWFKTWRNWVIRSHRKDGEVKTSFTPDEEIAQLERMIPTYEKNGRADYAQQARDRIEQIRGSPPPERNRRVVSIGQAVQNIRAA